MMHDAITLVKYRIEFHLTAIFIFHRNLMKNQIYLLSNHCCDVCGDIELAKNQNKLSTAFLYDNFMRKILLFFTGYGCFESHTQLISVTSSQPA